MNKMFNVYYRRKKTYVDTQRCLLDRVLAMDRFGHFFNLADISNL